MLQQARASVHPVYGVDIVVVLRNVMPRGKSCSKFLVRLSLGDMPETRLFMSKYAMAFFQALFIGSSVPDLKPLVAAIRFR
jgi:hypothetical protein